MWTGVSSKTLNDDVRIMRNQGMRRSLQNALQIALWGGVLCILVGASNEILYYGLYHGFGRGFHEGVLALCIVYGSDVRCALTNWKEKIL